MSTQLLRDDSLAQITNTLCGLSSLAGKGDLPKPLSSALKKLVDFTPMDYSDMRLFTGLANDADLEQRKNTAEMMVSGFSELNRNAYQKSHEGDELPPQKNKDDWRSILSKNGSLISLDFLESGISTTQSAMFRYFSLQLTRLSDNIGEEYFGKRLSDVLNEVALASSHAAFSVHPAYSESAIDPAVIADDLIKLSVNGQNLVVDSDGISDTLKSLSTAYTQGSSHHLISVDGADLMTYLLVHSNHEEVKIPTFNTHAEIPFKVPSVLSVSAIKYQRASDVGKPNDLSMLRLLKALDFIDLRYQNKKPEQLIKLDGTVFSQDEKDRLLNTIRGVRSSLSWQYAQKTQPFPPETVYDQDLKSFKRATTRSTPLYIIGDVSVMPASERLEELQVRLSESLPEVVFDIKRSVLPGVNSKRIDVNVSPRFGIDEASFYEMLTQDHDPRDRMIYALQDLASYAHAHDAEIQFVPGAAMDISLLRDLMINVPTVNEAISLDGHVTFENIKTNALSMPNVRNELVLVLKTPTKEFVARELSLGNFVAFDDLAKAKSVLEHLIEWEPDTSPSLNIAKFMMREQDVMQLRTALINEPRDYLLDRAMTAAIEEHNESWSMYSNEGRMLAIVSACRQRELLDESNLTPFVQSVRKLLDGKDEPHYAIEQVKAIRLDYMKKMHRQEDIKAEPTVMQQEQGLSTPILRR